MKHIPQTPILISHEARGFGGLHGVMVRCLDLTELSRADSGFRIRDFEVYVLVSLSSAQIFEAFKNQSLSLHLPGAFSCRPLKTLNSPCEI